MLKVFLTRGKNLVLKKQDSVASASFVLFLATLGSAFLGILRDRTLSGYFYSCCTQELDVYTSAFRIPDMLFSMLVAGAFSASFIPVFAQQYNKDKTTAHKMASVLLTLVLTIFFLVTVLVFVLARPLSILVAPGFSPGQIDLMVKLTRIMMVSQIFFSVSNFVTAILQTRQRFLLPAFAPIAYNLSIILGTIFLYPRFGIFAPTIGVVCGAFLHLAIQVPVLVKLGFSYHPSFDVKTEGVAKVGKLMLPRSFSLGLGQLETTLGSIVASTLPPGSVFIFNIARQLMQLPTRLFGATMGQAALPAFSKSASRQGLDKLSKVVIEVLIQVFFVSFPLSALFLTLRLPLVRLAFGAKQFPWPATLQTAKAVAYFAPAVFAQSGIQILIRAFYALQDTKTPLYSSAFALVVNAVVVGCFVFGMGWGVNGLALGISVGTTLQMVSLVLILANKLPNFSLFSVIIPTLKISYASLLAAMASRLTLRYMDLFVLDTSRTVNIILITGIAGTAGLIFYILTIYWLKLSQFDHILHKITTSTIFTALVKHAKK